MKFSGRTDEMALLRKFRDKSAENAQMLVLTGRRRMGSIKATGASEVTYGR